MALLIAAAFYLGVCGLAARGVWCWYYHADNEPPLHRWKDEELN